MSHGTDNFHMKPKAKKTPVKGRVSAVGSGRLVRKHPAPDADFEALKSCCLAIETCTSPRMVRATLDFLNSKYGELLNPNTSICLPGQK
jgi:hypothetical protein